jgi:nicotinate-nucleotide adenylyltransferase
VGVFGGAFDPPHAAHRALVEAALGQLQLDQLRIVPTGQAWHKARALSAAQDRLAMAELAFADLSRVVVDACETRRAGPSYTIDTLREIQALVPGAELYLVIGQDQAQALPGWRDWREVVRIAVICVAARPDPTGCQRPFVAPPELSQRFRQLDFPHLPVSATDIRQRFARGQGAGALVSDAVARYIVQHHLYPFA